MPDFNSDGGGGIYTYNMDECEKWVLFFSSFSVWFGLVGWFVLWPKIEEATRTWIVCVYTRTGKNNDGHFF